MSNYLDAVAALKAGKTCVKCGEAHPACLDWHHRDPAQKLFDIGGVAVKHRKLTLQEIAKEIEKCDVLCSNCHRKEHYHRIS